MPQIDNRWRHKNRICKRNLKSIYLDREDMTIKQAKNCPTYPPVRKRRYLFLGQYANIPKKTNIFISAILSANGIKLDSVFDANNTFKIPETYLPF